MPDDKRGRASMTPEGVYHPGIRPQGLKHVPSGVDELTTEHLIVNMGPQHPSTHGVLHILLELDGEEIVAAEISLGYLHRGVEKIAEDRRFHQVGTILDRADYVSGIHTELAFALATETLMELEVPPKADWIRCLMSEVNRISSHLVWLGTFGLDVGAMAPFLYTFRERERLLDILEAITGARLMFNYVRPGGVLADLPPEAEPMLRSFVADFPAKLEEYHGLLTGNEIFDIRVRDIGIISRETAVALGMTGPSLRGAGFGWDVRRERPYAAYGDLNVPIPVGQKGDSWDRYMVRMEEMKVSCDLIGRILDGMPEGDHMAKAPKVLRPPAGEVYRAVESPRGELGIHLFSDGSDKPYRVRLRPPALFNVQALEEVLPGLLIADAVATAASLDIVLGEIDR